MFHKSKWLNEILQQLTVVKSSSSTPTHVYRITYSLLFRKFFFQLVFDDALFFF